MNELQMRIYNDCINNIDTLNSFLYYLSVSINPTKIRVIDKTIEEKKYEDYISNLILIAVSNTNTNININDNVIRSVILDYINTILVRLNIRELKGV